MISMAINRHFPQWTRAVCRRTSTSSICISGCERRSLRVGGVPPHLRGWTRWKWLDPNQIGCTWWENDGEIWENDGKWWENMGKWWENDGKMMGKWWENDVKMMGKWCENDGKTMWKWWENDVKMEGLLVATDWKTCCTFAFATLPFKPWPWVRNPVDFFKKVKSLVCWFSCGGFLKWGVPKSPWLSILKSWDYTMTTGWFGCTPMTTGKPIFVHVGMPRNIQ